MSARSASTPHLILKRFLNIKVMNLKLLKQRVSLTLDEDIVEKIKLLAEDCDRSVSQYINIVLKEHLKKQADSLNE